MLYAHELNGQNIFSGIDSELAYSNEKLLLFFLQKVIRSRPSIQFQGLQGVSVSFDGFGVLLFFFNAVL